MNRNGPLALAFHTLFVVFMLAPIAIVCWVAFTPTGFLSVPAPHELSLRWFKAIGRYPEFVSAFWNSLWLAALSSLIAVTLSVPAALAIARHAFRGRDALVALFLSPLMIPHVVLGIAFLRLFTQIGLSGSFAGLVIAHVVIVMPFALRLVLASAVGTDRSLEHAAVSLGATDWVVFRRVTLPLILPGVISGALFAFATSFDEVVTVLFLGGPEQVTVPRKMWSGIREQISPAILAAATLLIAVAMILLIVVEWLRRRGERMKVTPR